MHIRRLLQSMVAGAIMACCTMAAAAAVNTQKPFTVPEVRQWHGADGVLALTSASRITYTDESLAPVAQQLADNYRELTSVALPTVKGKPSKGDIALSLKSDKKLGAEGYAIDINSHVAITSPTADGLRWGCMTLLQLCETSPDLPKGKITDFPKWGFRGFMIDAGRKYIPLDYLYKLVDVMAYYKMNVLHIHLNDNGFLYFFDNDWDKTQAAFRLESDTYPGLTARDGSYTKQEFRDFQKYALARGVEIIPEIDFPAHSLAFTRYMPELAAADGVNDADHLDLANPLTYQFLDALLREYLEGDDPVFVSRRFHIGTDEYQGDSTAMEQFRALTDRYIKYTKSFGKTPLIWGSLSHAKGHTPVDHDDVLMYLWSNDYARPLDMIEQGYDVVTIPDKFVYMVPAAGYYRDYLDLPMLYDGWTPANANGVDLGEDNPALKGGLFAVWNDHPGNGVTVKDIHHRVMHALPVMTTKLWDGSDLTVPFDTFAVKSAMLSEAPGVNYLGRYAKGERTVVMELPEVTPGMELPLSEIGYDYTVEFDLTGADEAPGTVLFSSPEATFWLSDPVTGNMGFSREGQLSSFSYDVRRGESVHVTITGDNKTTSLYIDGRLVDNLTPRRVSYNGSNRTMAQTHTLVFPLSRAGRFASKVTGLTVSNHIASPNK